MIPQTAGGYNQPFSRSCNDLVTSIEFPLQLFDSRHSIKCFFFSSFQTTWLAGDQQMPGHLHGIHLVLEIRNALQFQHGTIVIDANLTKETMIRSLGDRSMSGMGLLLAMLVDITWHNHILTNVTDPFIVSKGIDSFKWLNALMTCTYSTRCPNHWILLTQLKTNKRFVQSCRYLELTVFVLWFASDLHTGQILARQTLGWLWWWILVNRWHLARRLSRASCRVPSEWWQMAAGRNSALGCQLPPKDRKLEDLEGACCTGASTLLTYQKVR